MVSAYKLKYYNQTTIGTIGHNRYRLSLCFPSPILPTLFTFPIHPSPNLLSPFFPSSSFPSPILFTLFTFPFQPALNRPSPFLPFPSLPSPNLPVSPLPVSPLHFRPHKPPHLPPPGYLTIKTKPFFLYNTFIAGSICFHWLYSGSFSTK